jgi:hypothetical protein
MANGPALAKMAGVMAYQYRGVIICLAGESNLLKERNQ